MIINVILYYAYDQSSFKMRFMINLILDYNYDQYSFKLSLIIDLISDHYLINRVSEYD